MKKYKLTLLAAFAVAGTSFAGSGVASKEYKQPVVTPCFRDTEFAVDVFYTFNDAVNNCGTNRGDLNDIHRFDPGRFDPRRFDNNGLFRFSGTDNGHYFRDGSGGGIGFDYFFARYFGVSVEGNWWVGTNKAQFNGVAFRNGAGNVTVAATNGQTAGVAVIQNGQVVGVRSQTINGDSSEFHNVANQLTGSVILRYPIEGSFCWAPYIFGGGGGVWDTLSTGFGHAGLGAEWRVTPNIGVFTDWRWQWMANRNDVNTTRAGVRFVF